VQSVILRLTPAPRRLSSVTARALGFSVAVAGHALIWAAYCLSCAERSADRSSARTSTSLLTVSVSLPGTMPEPAAAPSAFAPRLVEPARSVAISLQSLASLRIAPGTTAAAAPAEIVLHQDREQTAARPSAPADESHPVTPQSEAAPLGYAVAPSSRQVPRAPRPLPGQALPEYPESAREDGLEGLVVLAVEVDADGHVLAVAWARRSGVPVLDYSAREAIVHWRFQPAHDGLSPVTGRTQVSVRFSLRAAEAVAIAQVQR
jgi:protein TonB